MGELTGKVVLITGADKGIGRALVAAFAEQGAIVVANALTPVNLDESIAPVQARGGQAQAYVADIASKLALQTMLNEIMDQYGCLDILVQTAGVEPTDPFLELDEWDWRRTLNTNLTGPFLLMQSAGRIMREQGGGVMINLVDADQETRAAAFGKAGLLALTRAAASEFGAHHIRVIAINNGAPDGEQLAGFPTDPVDLVLILCSQETSDVYGKIIHCPLKP